MSQSTPRRFACCEVKVRSRCNLWDQSWAAAHGFPTAWWLLYWRRLLQNDSVAVELFFIGRNDILKRCGLGDFVRYLERVALWRFIFLCEYIIFQWGPPGNLICVKLWKGVCFGGWKWECGQHFTSFHEFRYSNKAPQEKWWSVVCVAESLTRLHVLHFRVPGTELALPPHRP